MVLIPLTKVKYFQSLHVHNEIAIVLANRKPFFLYAKNVIFSNIVSKISCFHFIKLTYGIKK